MAAITKSFTVQEDQIQVVKDRLAKMNRKAAVLGIEPAIISAQEERLVQIKSINEWTGKSIVKLLTVVDITVIGYMIKFGNYTHVATLDHTVSDMPIVKSVPDQIVPTIYQSAKPHCDHCGIVRQRNNTFVFKDAAGYKQVGSSCLRDFFGIDPTKTIDWFSSFYDLGNNDEFGGFAEPTASNKTVVAMAAAELQGYVSGKQAKETGIESTSDAVKFLLNPPSHMDAATISYVRSTWSRAGELENWSLTLLT